MGSFRVAVESGDIEQVVGCLASDVTFLSPVVYKPYEGRDVVGMVLRAVFQVFEDFAYVEEMRDGDREILIFRARVGDRTVEGADFVRYAADGHVAELRVMLRPMSGLLAVAEAMRAQLAAAS